jgi:hypothetical protein
VCAYIDADRIWDMAQSILSPGRAGNSEDRLVLIGLKIALFHGIPGRERV